MIVLSIDKVDGFVAKLQRKGVNVVWDGWDMVFLKADPRAIRSTDGRYQRNSRGTGEWGFHRVISPNAEGRWAVPYGLTKGSNA